ncbi:MAG: glycosyltransferase family 4 protein [Myxococcales bacterium]|nr:glycosyltransferase family 4 protein [Myxococcales bacterium]MCB9530696.1 glycosyltransferase family 4 protein [Myxococcales bacterium]
MKPKLVIVTTVPISIAAFLEGQPRHLTQWFDVHLVCGPGAGKERVERGEGLPVTTIPLTRKITPRDDLQALAALTRYLRRLRPDIVHTYTPKAGLVGMMAAAAARVPHRIHSVVGMPLMEATGKKAQVLAVTERVTYALATDLWSNSTGLRSWIHEHLTRRPIEVVGHGSTNGVDAGRFDRDLWPPDQRAALRAELGIPADAFVFVFVGRIVRDKGIHELVDAFTKLHVDHPDTRLVLLGDYERDLDPLSPATDAAIQAHPAIVTPGWVDDVRPTMAYADVYVLPSYREGLPNSLVEAGAMSLPAIATDINGCNEVIVPGENGLLVPVRDARALESAMRSLVEDRARHADMRARARTSVLARFSQPYFYGELVSAYHRVLGRPTT